MNLDQKIRTAYDEFIKLPIEPLYDVIEVKKGEVIIRVFDFLDDSKKLKLELNDGGLNTSDLVYRRFPIAQVVKCGNANNDDDLLYSPGEIVRLSDQESMLYGNPLTKGYVDNKYKNSNLEHKGFNLDGTSISGELPVFKTDFAKNYARHSIQPDPINSTSSNNVADYVYFAVPQSRVRRISDPSVFGMKVYDADGKKIGGRQEHKD